MGTLGKFQNNIRMKRPDPIDIPIDHLLIGRGIDKGPPTFAW